MNYRAEIKRAAIGYAKAGYAVFPCRLNKRPCIDEWQHVASSDPEQVAKWWDKYPEASIGMPTGEINNVYVVDIDDKPEREDKRPGHKGEIIPAEDGAATLANMEAEYEPLPPTKMQRTGSGGMHLMFAYPIDHPLLADAQLRNTARKLGPGIDTRGEGGYIIVAPSKHPSGRRYELIHEAKRNPFAPLPDWLIRLLLKPKAEPPPKDADGAHSPAFPAAGGNTHYGQAALDGLYNQVATAPEGARNDTLNRAAYRVGRLVAGGEIDPAAAQSLKQAARHAGLAPAEINKTFASGFAGGQQNPVSAPERPQPRARKSNDNKTNPNLPPARAQVAEEEEAPPLPDLDDVPIPDIDDPDTEAFITLSDGQRPQILDLIRGEIEQSEIIFNRGGSMVMTVRETMRRTRDGLIQGDGALRIEDVTDYGLMAFLDRRAHFQKWSDRADGYVPTYCPKEIARLVLADRENWPWRILQAVIEAPTLRHDGSLVTASGYDTDTRLYFDAGGVDFDLDEIAGDLTLEDARNGVEILNELIGTFPFVDETAGPNGPTSPSRSVVLCAMMTGLVRPILPSAPMFVISAPVAGAGKTKLADIVSILATGRASTIISYTKDEAEFEKRGAALLMRGHSVICLDNFNGVLESDWLCRVLTQTHVESRVLGESRTVTSPTTSTWLVTGNNVTPVQDIVRRTLFCYIDPKSPNPDAREFAWDPVQRAREMRPVLVRACLAIMRAYQQAGKPDVGVTTLGSFEAWSGLVRSALVWAGEADPCDQRKILEDNDFARMGLRGVLQAWHDAAMVGNYTCGEIIKHAPGELKEALLEVCGDARQTLAPARINRYLSKHKNRVEVITDAAGVETAVRCESKPGRGGNRWRIAYVEENNPDVN